MKISFLLQVILACSAYAGRPKSHKDFLTGHVTQSQIHDWIYVPFEVKPGVTSISVKYTYPKANGTNVLDIGLFDERGHQVEDAANATAGFRGWSFALLDSFELTPAWTTPSYISGPIAHGTWHIVLGPRAVASADGFDWNATVTYGYESVTERFSAALAPTDLGLDGRRRSRVDPQDGEVWLRGDFHVHSIYSDGTYLPEEQVSNAQLQNLDFFYFTEHNSHSGNDAWGVWAPEDMLVGRGMEVTSRYGHWQAIGIERGQTIEWRYGPNSTGYAHATEQVRRSGGFVSVNHPYMDCVECLWNLDHEYRFNDAMEVWNGYAATDLNEPALALWQTLLVKGHRMTAIGGSDTHNPPSMIGKPTTYVKARSLSSASIVEGVKRRRVYIVDSPTMEMDFTIRGEGVHAQIGDVVKKDRVRDTLEACLNTVGLGGLQVSWVSERGYIRNETMGNGTANTLAVKGDLQFLRVEVRNSTGSLIGLTNPIFFE
ncbi:hypothetical protein ACJ41O_000539 [Fusarium nematophilum]